MSECTTARHKFGTKDEWCQMALKSSLPQPGLVKPEPVVWRGDTELPLSEQGVKVLGVPIGQPACVQLFLAKIGRSKTLCSNVSRGCATHKRHLLMCGSTCGQLLAAGSGSLSNTGDFANRP